MVRGALRVSVAVCLLLLLALSSLPPSLSLPATAQGAGSMLVYHQITNMIEGSGSMGYPVLSADGTRGVFSDAPGTGDPETPNRIYTIAPDGSGLTEVDSYVPLCFCGSMVDISNDGTTVISTDSVQVRIVDAGGARELVIAAGNEISAAVVSGDGQSVFFTVRRDTATADGATPLPRGVWAIDAGGSDLRQLVGAGDIAEILGITIEETGCCFHGDGRPLDASDSGDHVVFGSYGGTEEHVFAVDGDGGNLHLLRESLQYVFRVAVSGDGTMAAFEVTPLGSTTNEIAVVPMAGGEPRVLASLSSYSYDELLQLTPDGSMLLVSPNGLLIDTATGEARLLAVSITDAGGSHSAVLTDGLVRVSMNADASRFLYVMRTVRCADCANLQEQLAVLEIDPADLGQAPAITGATIDPASIELDNASTATAEATVESESTVIGVGFAALLGAMVDANVAHGRLLLDDGQNGDARANDGVYTAAGIAHSFMVARENDGGPRVVRIAAEVEGSDGLRHATAVDIGTLWVGPIAASPVASPVAMDHD